MISTEREDLEMVNPMDWGMGILILYLSLYVSQNKYLLGKKRKWTLSDTIQTGDDGQKESRLGFCGRFGWNSIIILWILGQTLVILSWIVYLRTRHSALFSSHYGTSEGSARVFVREFGMLEKHGMRTD